jgi:hypothetical protein
MLSLEEHYMQLLLEHYKASVVFTDAIRNPTTRPELIYKYNLSKNEAIKYAELLGKIERQLGIKSDKARRRYEQIAFLQLINAASSNAKH